ncbi:HEPN domain-containing protein [Mucilaginibacter flavidus]|uniref:HEPN domain-containing protein n=1 Tax=Mucilaginibacter flavidus TaxID=2949309 RepID=UPI0020935B64|nr:HEPN domain-containing protein [Mucilaginibacter flavidus]MCO5950589.1 HEPN domain-containing protein [Mucilaginibacter flavidus]
MDNLVYAPWEQMPFHLRLEEVQRPLSVLEEFFFIRCPASHLKFLKEWRHFVLCDQFYNDKSDGPGHLLFVHEWNIKLLEALYLVLLDYKENRYQFMPVPDDQLSAEERRWSWFPKELAQDEQADPYLAVNRIFKKISLPKFRDYLKEWLSAALYKQEIDESMRPAEVVKVFDSLEKLYCAAWLIRQRQGNDTENEALDRQEDLANETVGVELPVEIKEPEPLLKLDFFKTMRALCSGLTGAGELGLDEVKTVILKEVPSVRNIVVLGMHAKLYTYYLLVVIHDSDKTPEHEVANKIEDICKQLAAVFAIVHRAAWASQEIVAGDHFWNNAIYNGTEVYTSEGFTLPEHKAVGKDERKEAARKDWNRWGRQGLQFLKGAKRYVEEEQYGIAVFMLHQAAESCLIGIIRVLSGYRTSSHNLSRMLRLTLLYTDEIMDVLELEKPEEAKLFNLLQSAYSEARYKGDFWLEETTAKLLSLKVQLLVKKIEVFYLKLISTP